MPKLKVILEKNEPYRVLVFQKAEGAADVYKRVTEPTEQVTQNFLVACKNQCRYHVPKVWPLPESTLVVSYRPPDRWENQAELAQHTAEIKSRMVHTLALIYRHFDTLDLFLLGSSKRMSELNDTVELSTQDNPELSNTTQVSAVEAWDFINAKVDPFYELGRRGVHALKLVHNTTTTPIAAAMLLGNRKEFKAWVARHTQTLSGRIEIARTSQKYSPSPGVTSSHLRLYGLLTLKQPFFRVLSGLSEPCEITPFSDREALGSLLAKTTGLLSLHFYMQHKHDDSNNPKEYQRRDTVFQKIIKKLQELTERVDMDISSDFRSFLKAQPKPTGFISHEFRDLVNGLSILDDTGLRTSFNEYVTYVRENKNIGYAEVISHIILNNEPASKENMVFGSR